MFRRFAYINRRQKYLLLINVFVRTILPLCIFINPFTGIIIGVISDGYDYYLLVRYAKLANTLYQYQDKILDYYWYILILIYSIIYLPIQSIKYIIIITFIFRSIGYLHYLAFNDEKIFLYFPNIQEPIFWLWVIYPTLLDQQVQFISLSIITILKILNEYYIHVIHINPINQILEKIGIKSNF